MDIPLVEIDPKFRWSIHFLAMKFFVTSIKDVVLMITEAQRCND
jgi:hypothetical protein